MRTEVTKPTDKTLATHDGFTNADAQEACQNSVARQEGVTDMTNDFKKVCEQPQNSGLVEDVEQIPGRDLNEGKERFQDEKFKEDKEQLQTCSQVQETKERHNAEQPPDNSAAHIEQSQDNDGSVEDGLKKPSNQDDATEPERGSERGFRRSKKPHGCIRALGYLSLLIVIVGASFGCGLWIGLDHNMLLKAQNLMTQMGGGDAEQAVNHDAVNMLKRIDHVNEILSDQALELPDYETRTQAAIKALVGTLPDKYAEYYNPEEYEKFKLHTNGSFKGIGVMLGGTKDNYVVVIRVFPNTPAEAGGLKPGDIITSVNGGERPTTSEEVSKQISGATTPEVEVSWIRPTNSDHPQDGSDPTGEKMSAQFVPQNIEIPTVSSAIKGDVGIISIAQFSEHTADQVKKAMKSLDEQGAACYVIDLRNNPGGLLQQAIDITSLFVKEGEVVRVQSRAQSEEVRKVTGAWLSDKPIAVIINGHSASASEIMAVALKDHKRATIVGTTSFGKGSVQVVQPLYDHDAIKFTIAHYTSPNNTAIDGVGVKPDVEVGAADSEAFYELTPNMLAKDPQMKAAFEALGRPGVD